MTPRTRPIIHGDITNVVAPYPLLITSNGLLQGGDVAARRYREALLDLRDSLDTPNPAQDALLVGTLPVAMLIADMEGDPSGWLHPDHGDVPLIVAVISVFAHWFMEDEAHRWTSSALPLPNLGGETMLRIDGALEKRMGVLKPYAPIHDLSHDLCREGIKAPVALQALVMALASMAAQTAWQNPAILSKAPGYPYHLAGSMAVLMHAWWARCRQIEAT